MKSAAELLAFLLCLAGLVVASPQAGIETRVAESPVDAEEGTSERDDDDDPVVTVSGAGTHRHGLIPSYGAPATSDRDNRAVSTGAGFVAPLLAGAPPALDRPFSLHVAGAAQAPRAWLAQVFLAPVRPRGPTLSA